MGQTEAEAAEAVTGWGGASAAELVEALSVCVSELAARRPPESVVACMELAERLGRVIDVGEAALAALVRRVDCAGEVRGSGYSCTSAWLRDRLGMRTGRARERLTLARRLSRLERTGERLRTGDLSYGYAATLTDALARLDEADAKAGEQILSELADDGACADRVARAGVRIGEVVAERDGREPTPADARRGFKRSWISRSASLDGGTWVTGRLSAEHAAVWNQTLAPLTKPTGAADDRDHAHRTAGALHSILSQGHQRTTATVIIDLDTLNGGTRPAHLPGGGQIPAERARQIALTAGVSALILGSGGHPLYLGRTARFATRHQRRVLEALYDTCAVQGCEIPTRYCEIHHTGGGWKTGTPTSHPCAPSTTNGSNNTPTKPTNTKTTTADTSYGSYRHGQPTPTSKTTTPATPTQTPNHKAHEQQTMLPSPARLRWPAAPAVEVDPPLSAARRA